MTPIFERRTPRRGGRRRLAGLAVAALAALAPVAAVLAGPAPLARAAPADAAVAETVEVVGLRLTGLERTSPRWLTSYVDYEFPARMSLADAKRVQRKVMTTGVFTDVKVTFDPAEDKPDAFYLHVHVEEKWTTIPVVRGVYGGGTPLRILGVYDTHTFGRLITLGGEMRKYGDAPPGFVVYARDPRSQSGRYYLGAEFWRDFRRRQVYEKDGGDPIGAVSTNAAITRLRLLTPLGWEEVPTREHNWKYGLEVEVAQEAPAVFDPAPDAATDEPPAELHVGDEASRQSKVMPTLLYDDIDLSVLDMEGFRAKLRAGPLLGAEKVHSAAELETFGYVLFPHEVNLALHTFLGESSYASLTSQYFLGGLDSIRGLPDGAVYGNHAGYANAELRQVLYKAKYLWLQGVLFADAGGAGEDWGLAKDAVRASAGAGLRFAIPQVYRMVFRIDYAWSVDGSHTQGITAGMNQFFDPYTPL